MFKNLSQTKPSLFKVLQQLPNHPRSPNFFPQPTRPQLLWLLLPTHPLWLSLHWLNLTFPFLLSSDMPPHPCSLSPLRARSAGSPLHQSTLAALSRKSRERAEGNAFCSHGLSIQLGEKTDRHSTCELPGATGTECMSDTYQLEQVLFYCQFK